MTTFPIIDASTDGDTIRAARDQAAIEETQARAEESRSRAFQQQASAIYNLIMPTEDRSGYVYDPASVVEAVTSGDLTKLRT